MGSLQSRIQKSDFSLLLRNLLYKENVSMADEDRDYAVKDTLDYQDFKDAAIQFIIKNPTLIITEQ